MLHYKAINHDTNGKSIEWKKISLEETKGLTLTYFDDGVSQWDQETGKYQSKNNTNCFVIGY